MDVLILSGGKGTRLRPVVNDRPKIMAEVCGKPFLNLLISYVESFGYSRFILCTGYKSDYIRQYYETKRISSELIFSHEEKPLGTAGAIKNAEKLIKTETFMVLNGDSFCAAKLNEFSVFHKSKLASLSMVVTTVQNSADYGSVCINDFDEIIMYGEKRINHNLTANAGIYVFQRRVLDKVPPNSYYSLELDLFPKFVGQAFYGFRVKEKLIDIGTPKRYNLAQKYLRKYV